MKNRIINGDMRVDQRNEGAVLTTTSAQTTWKSVDKFNGFLSGTGNFSMQRLSATPPPGFTNYSRIITTTADAAPAATSNYFHGTNIEGFLVQDDNFGTANATNLAISFQFRSSLTGTFSGSLRNSGGTRSYPFAFNIAAANTWTTVKITVPGDITGTWLFNNGIGISLFFNLGSGSNFLGTAATWQGSNFVGVTGSVALISTLNATIDITGVQLEVASGATSFDYLLYGVQLLLCQRYYQKSFSAGTAPAQSVGVNSGETQISSALGTLSALGFIQTRFIVPVRSTPTVVTYNPSAGNIQVRDETGAVDCSSTATTPSVNAIAFFYQTNASTVVGNKLGVHWTADADL